MNKSTRLALGTTAAFCGVAIGGIFLHAALNADTALPPVSSSPVVTIAPDAPAVVTDAAYEAGFSDGTDAAINRLFDALNVPCATEDSEGCYWDAATRGNGEGRPFVNINGRVVYLDFQ